MARKTAVRVAAATRKAPAKRAAPKKVLAPVTKKVLAPVKAAATTAVKPIAPQAAAPKPPRSAKMATPLVRARKAPSLDRERRVAVDDDFAPSPPSSLDLDRTASSARSGRHELAEKFHDHTETSPVLTGGDIDGNWESAYSVGDEAPGGSSPTPDQTVVEDIGSALGVVYEDDEELTSEKKISDRDKHRWELDPESSDDYEER
ncbi:MAG: hypothetical protein HOP16_19485 [Acidobacteria bacterium]|nr:hypothetical protein [Acidobacteriota bacterium]